MPARKPLPIIAYTCMAKPKGDWSQGRRATPMPKYSVCVLTRHWYQLRGTYCLKENIPTEYLDKAVQVSYLDGQGLVFELME